MNQPTHQTTHQKLNTELSFTKNNIDDDSHQIHNAQTYGHNVQNINKSQSFSRINQQYIQLRNKVEDRIKILESKCHQDNNMSFSHKWANQRNTEHGRDRERVYSNVHPTNPSNINNLLNNPSTSSLSQQVRTSFISYQTPCQRQVGHPPTNIDQFHQHPSVNGCQNVNPCFQCQSNSRMFYSHGFPLNSNKINSSANTSPQTNANKTQQIEFQHQVPRYEKAPIQNCYPNHSSIERISQPNTSQLAQSINLSNNGTLQSIQTNTNISEVILQNIKTQKQINMNLKALSQRLSDFSGRRSDQNVIYRDNRNSQSRLYQQIRPPYPYPYPYPYHHQRPMDHQKQYSDNSQREAKEIAYYHSNPHYNGQKMNKYAKNKNIYYKNQESDQKQYYPQCKSPRQNGKIKNVPFLHNNLIKSRESSQQKTKLKKTKKDNQVLSLNQNRQRRFKQVHKISPNVRFQKQKSSRTSNSVNGRAKSASVNTLPTSQKNRKLYTFKGVKQPQIAGKRQHIKRKNDDNRKEKKRQLDPDYFAQKSPQFYNFFPYQSNPHLQYETNNYDYKFHQCPYQHHPNHHNNNCYQLPPHPHHQPHHISSNKSPHSRHSHHHHEKHQRKIISPEDEILQIYNSKKRNKEEVYKDSQHRNKKHERDHLIHSFHQQQKLRKELIQKISRNFFNKYGVK